MAKKIEAEHGVVCSLGEERFGYFGWTSVGRMDDGLDEDLGYPCSVELSDGSILTVYYQKLVPGKNTSVLWSRWRL